MLAAVIAAARLKLPVNLRGYLAFTENMTGGRGSRGSATCSRSATARRSKCSTPTPKAGLILADALSYAAEAKPARMLPGDAHGLVHGRASGSGHRGPLEQRRPLRRRRSRSVRPLGRAGLEIAPRRRLQGSAQEPGGRPQERRRQVGRRCSCPRSFLNTSSPKSPWAHLDMPAQAGTTPTAMPRRGRNRVLCAYSDRTLSLPSFKGGEEGRLNRFFRIDKTRKVGESRQIQGIRQAFSTDQPAWAIRVPN